MRKSSLLVIGAMLFFSVSCSSVQYQDPAKAKGGREWGAKEIQETTKLMVDSIYAFFKDEWKGPAMIRVKSVVNKSSQHVQPKMLTNAITSNLIKKKIAIEEDEFIKETLEEIEKSQAGLIDENYSIPVGSLKSPNFILSGRIDDNVTYEGGKETQYIVVMMKLTNLATGQSVWSDTKEFYKVASTKSYSW